MHSRALRLLEAQPLITNPCDESEFCNRACFKTIWATDLVSLMFLVCGLLGLKRKTVRHRLVFNILLSDLINVLFKSATALIVLRYMDNDATCTMSFDSFTTDESRPENALMCKVAISLTMVAEMAAVASACWVSCVSFHAVKILQFASSLRRTAEELERREQRFEAGYVWFTAGMTVFTITFTLTLHMLTVYQLGRSSLFANSVACGVMLWAKVATNAKTRAEYAALVSEARQSLQRLRLYLLTFLITFLPQATITFLWMSTCYGQSQWCGQRCRDNIQKAVPFAVALFCLQGAINVLNFRANGKFISTLGSWTAPVADYLRNNQWFRPSEDLDGDPTRASGGTWHSSHMDPLLPSPLHDAVEDLGLSSSPDANVASMFDNSAPLLVGGGYDTDHPLGDDPGRTSSLGETDVVGLPRLSLLRQTSRDPRSLPKVWPEELMLAPEPAEVGSTAQVFLGVFKGNDAARLPACPVAVKVQPNNADCVHEVTMLRQIAHEHVMTLHGVCCFEPNIGTVHVGLVCELCPMNLEDLILLPTESLVDKLELYAELHDTAAGLQHEQRRQQQQPTPSPHSSWSTSKRPSRPSLVPSTSVRALSAGSPTWTTPAAPTAEDVNFTPLLAAAEAAKERNKGGAMPSFTASERSSGEPTGERSTTASWLSALGHASRKSRAELAEKAIFTPHLLRRLALELVATVDHLHAHDVVHRDLKPLNLLLDHHLSLKICDLATARVWVRDEARPVSIDTFTSSFCPPELSTALNKSPSSPRTRAPALLPTAAAAAPTTEAEVDPKLWDVFSCGMVLWCMTQRSLPFEHLRSPDAQKTQARIQAAIAAGERPDFNRPCPVSLEALTRAMWSHDPNGRPTLRHARAVLEKDPLVAGWTEW